MFLFLIKGGAVYRRGRSPRPLLSRLFSDSRRFPTKCFAPESPPRELAFSPLHISQQPEMERPYSEGCYGLIFSGMPGSFGLYAHVRPKPKFGAFDLGRGVGNDLFSLPAALRFAPSPCSELE